MATVPITGTLYTNVTHADSSHGADHTAIFDALTAVAARIFVGTGSPESAKAAPVGSIFIRTDGGADSVLYTKESGTGNTGWTAMAGVA